MGRIRLSDSFEDIARKLAGGNKEAYGIVMALGSDPRLTREIPLTEKEIEKGLKQIPNVPDMRIIHTLDDKGIYGDHIVNLHKGVGQGDVVLTAGVILATRHNFNFVSLMRAAEAIAAGHPSPINAFEMLGKVREHHFYQHIPNVAPKVAPVDEVKAQEPVVAVPAARPVITPLSTPIVVKSSKREEAPALMGPPRPTAAERTPAYA